MNLVIRETQAGGMNTRAGRRPWNDEVDLRELRSSLWRQRYLLGGTIAAVAMLTLAHAWLATPYHEVQRVLRPIAPHALDRLDPTGLYALFGTDALNRVEAALRSEEVRLEFLRSDPQLFEPLREDGVPQERLLERFNREAFSLVRPEPQKDDGLSSYVAIRLVYPKGMDGAAAIDGLVDFVIAGERQRIAEDFALLVEKRITRVRDDIAQTRYTTAKQSPDALAHDAEREAEAQQPHGPEQQRLEQLIGWEGELARLQTLRPELSALPLVRLERRAAAPVSPIEPQRVLALGLAMGGFLGLFLVLLRDLWRDRPWPSPAAQR